MTNMDTDKSCQNTEQTANDSGRLPAVVRANAWATSPNAAPAGSASSTTSSGARCRAASFT